MSTLNPKQIQRIRDEYANSPEYNHVRQLLAHIDGEPGRIREAKADAWAEGYSAAVNDAWDQDWPDTPNPYLEGQ